jgi:SAM-dependent methyltransferase
MEGFQRYLRAKRTVDDRALDRRLLDDLSDRLSARAEAGNGPLRVLEIGAGIGTMLARFLEWNVFPAGAVEYTAVDIRPENIAAMEGYVREWADDRAVAVSDTPTGTLLIDGPDHSVELDPTVAEATEFAGSTAGYDLVVGAALLDVLDVSDVRSLLTPLADGGLFYFPITFDGATRFLPAHPADGAVEGRYHDHMDAKPGGCSRAGDEVFAHLQRSAGVTVDAAGSDWVVAPTDGTYPADEAFFLRYILDTVEDAVGEMTDGEFEPLERWLRRRREQLDERELLYLTHQLDVLGRVDDSAALASGTE